METMMISFSKQSAKYLLFLCVIATLLTTLSSRPYRTSTAIYHNVGSQRIQHSPSSSGMMRLHATTSSGSVGTANDAVIDIRTVTNSELELAAEFLTYYMYPSSIPTGQRKELQRLEKQDLDQRYSERLGKKKFPSAMFCVVPNGSSRLKSAKDLIGVVGLDCQAFSAQQQKLESIFSTREGAADSKIVPVLANLAIKSSERKKGYAQQLIKTCEDFVKTSGYTEIYLLVDSTNIAAQKLYQKLGYKKLFEDKSATCIISTSIGLRTQECVNYCYRKDLSSSSGSKGSNGLFNFFGNLFTGNKK